MKLNQTNQNWSRKMENKNRKYKLNIHKKDLAQTSNKTLENEIFNCYVNCDGSCYFPAV